MMNNAHPQLNIGEGMPTATLADVDLDADLIERAWQSIVDASDAHQFGGAVLGIVRRGRVALVRHTGWAVREPASERTRMADDTIFDLASLTKVVATTPVMLRLIADGQVEIDAPLGRYIPEFGCVGDKAQVTIRRLLSHSAGITSWRGVFTEGTGADAYVRSLATDQPYVSPGSRVEYSCMGFILLHEVIRRLTGETIDVAARRLVFDPLDMREAMFTPPVERRNRIAATEQGNGHERGMDERTPTCGAWRDYLLRGEVHDGNAWYGFAGVSGNAGLFGTLRDLLRYGQMWLNGGALDGERVLPEELVAEATSEQTGLDAPNDRRGLGWQMVPHPDDEVSDSFSGRGLSQRAFGHTGFTGTSIWMDPERDLVVCMLANRVHPRVRTDYLPVRANVHQMIADACL